MYADIEHIVLGDLLLPDDIEFIKGKVLQIKEEDFVDPLNMRIFNAIRGLIAENKPLDMFILQDKFPDNEGYILEIATHYATNANIDVHIEKLKENSIKHKVLLNCEELARDLSTADNPLEMITDFNNQNEAVLLDNQSFEFIDTKETIKNVVDMVKSARESDTSTMFVPYCIPAMDSLLSLLRKQMHVLAADSRVGKTALGLSALYQQIQKDMRIIYFCGESSKEEVLMRLIAIAMDVEFMEIVRGFKNSSPKAIENFFFSLEVFKKYAHNFYIDGKGTYTHDASIIDFLTSTITRKRPLDMMYVDNLQNMHSPKHLFKASKHEQVGYNIWALNQTTGDCDVASTVMCQLNRGAEQSERPRLCHLKYSSDIENEAHVITFLYRKEKHDEVHTAEVIPTEWYSEKTRVQGKIFSRLAFKPKSAHFVGMYAIDYEKKFREGYNPKRERRDIYG